MIPVSRKALTLRVAEAQALLRISPATSDRILSQDLPKKDPLGVARTAGILAAKRTPELLPYCHPIPLDGVDLHFKLERGLITVSARVEAVWKTGVEMEALSAVSVAALALYDMLKPLDPGMEISSVRLLSKEGGKTDRKGPVPEGLRAAVVTCSDSAYQGRREDLSGIAVLSGLRELGLDASYAVVPDEKAEIRRKIEDLCALGTGLVLTTGGTGLSPRDVTVEAVRELMDREVPGLAEAARAHGQHRTPLAMFSRGLAAQRGGTLILTLPGSPKGVQDWMDALLPGLLHALPMMEGRGHP